MKKWPERLRPQLLHDINLWVKISTSYRAYDFVTHSLIFGPEHIVRQRAEWARSRRLELMERFVYRVPRVLRRRAPEPRVAPRYLGLRGSHRREENAEEGGQGGRGIEIIHNNNAEDGRQENNNNNNPNNRPPFVVALDVLQFKKDDFYREFIRILTNPNAMRVFPTNLQAGPKHYRSLTVHYLERLRTLIPSSQLERIINVNVRRRKRQLQSLGQNMGHIVEIRREPVDVDSAVLIDTIFANTRSELNQQRKWRQFVVMTESFLRRGREQHLGGGRRWEEWRNQLKQALDRARTYVLPQ